MIATRPKRHTSRIAKNFTMTKESVEWLERHLEGGKTQGAWLSSLVLQERARIEERQRIRAVLEAPSVEEATS